MKLSALVKKQITEDWNRSFPDLGVYKPLWLLRRVGPLVCGICLNRDSGNDAYCPTLHTHNLSKVSPVVTLTLADPLRTIRTGVPETIRAVFHQQRFDDAAERLRRQALIPLSGSVHLDDCLAAYREYMHRPIGRYPLSLFEDLVTLFIWCGQRIQAEQELRKYEKAIREWPENAQPESGVDAWIQQCGSWIENPDEVRSCVSTQTQALGLNVLPFVELTP
jgi:hypothetical protein